MRANARSSRSSHRAEQSDAACRRASVPRRRRLRCLSSRINLMRSESLRRSVRCGRCRGFARARAAGIGVEGFLGLDRQLGPPSTSSTGARLIGGRIAPAHRGVAALVVHDGADAPSLAVSRGGGGGDGLFLYDLPTDYGTSCQAPLRLLQRQINRARRAAAARSVTESRRSSDRLSDLSMGAQQADALFTSAIVPSSAQARACSRSSSAPR